MFSKITRSFIAILLLTVKAATAQDHFQKIAAVEDTLLGLADSMYTSFIPDERPIYTEKFVKTLITALKVAGSFEYPFDRLKEKINIMYPEDRNFRLFNWVIAISDVNLRYYGAVQLNSEQLKLYPLIDYTAQLGKGAEDSVLTNGKWYGALYYRIIRQEVDEEPIYTLFGKNGSSIISDKKVLDPMIVTPNGIVFGAPVFNVRSETNPNERIRRFIIEYKKGVQASMNWDKEMNAIFFDKLVSEQNDPNRKYTFVPSGQYDGFRWNGTSWDYMQDLIPIDVLQDGQAPVPTPIKEKE